jgi:hypothetical protein
MASDCLAISLDDFFSGSPTQPLYQQALPTAGWNSKWITSMEKHK